MKSFDDDTPQSEVDNRPVDREELERSLTPSKDTTISPELLDELFEMEDPRVQSGIDDDDSDDDLDFIRMSGLTSPEASADIGAIDELPVVDEVLSPPVSFYEPGVADVDAAMEPDAGYESESVLDDEFDPIPPPLKSADDPATESATDSATEDEVAPEPMLADSESLEAPADVSELPSPVVDDESVVLEVETSIPLAVDAADALDDAEQVVDDDSVVLEVDGSFSLDVDAADVSEEFESDRVEVESPTTPISNESDAAVSEVIDLDSPGDDEVFPELELPISVEIEMEAEASAEETVNSSYAQDSTSDVDLVECPEATESFADAQDEDESLVAVSGDTDDDTTLNDSVIDDILVDTNAESPVEELVLEEMDAVEPIPEISVESKLDLPAHELAPEATMAVTPTPETETREEIDEPTARENNGRRSSRHHRRHQPSLHRIMKAAAVVLVIGGAMVYAGYEGYRWFEIQIANPTTLYYEGEAAAARGEHLQASRLFEEFARRNSDHPLAGDATFAAGYQMQQVESEDPQLVRQYNQESLALLGEFARRYPDHSRAGRARSLMGIIHYRKGDYRAAVDALIDRDAILRDPAATLPMLRTLARSYARLGEYEAAHSTYTQAANSPGNPSPDADYDELGEMYQVLAQSAETTDQHLAYQELAIEHWSHAARYPGINPTRKNAIRVKVDLLGKLGALSGTPPTVAVQTQRSGLVVPLEGGMQATQASFELTTPLPFGPIIKGVPGNDDPEPVDEHVATLSSAEPSIDLTFEVVTENPFETEDGPTTNNSVLEPAGDSPRVRYHEIASGEQLFQIAVDYDVSAADLMQWNQIENVDHIEIGQRLLLSDPESYVE